MTLTDALFAHTATVTGLPERHLRAAASPIGDDLDAAHDLVTLAQSALGAGEPRDAAAVLDDAIQKLVSLRHNIAPGDPVQRYLPDLRPGLVLMEAESDRWAENEWRPSRRHPGWYVDQDGVPCDPHALPASLVVVEASAERVA